MQKECSLTDTPQRSRAKFIRPGVALDDVIGKAETHMVKREIGESEKVETYATEAEMIAFGLNAQDVARAGGK